MLAQCNSDFLAHVFANSASAPYSRIRHTMYSKKPSASGPRKLYNGHYDFIHFPRFTLTALMSEPWSLLFSVSRTAHIPHNTHGLGAAGLYLVLIRAPPASTHATIQSTFTTTCALVVDGAGSSAGTPGTSAGLGPAVHEETDDKQLGLAQNGSPANPSATPSGPTDIRE